MPQLVAQGTANNLSQLGDYQSQFPEYSEGYVELELVSPVAADVIGWLAEKVKAVGVPAGKVVTEGRFVYINFKTEIAPLVLIAGAIAACIIVLGLIVAWKLWRTSGTTVVTWAIIIPIIIVGSIIGIIWLVSRYGGKLLPKPS